MCSMMRVQKAHYHPAEFCSRSRTGNIPDPMVFRNGKGAFRNRCLFKNRCVLRNRGVLRDRRLFWNKRRFMEQASGHGTRPEFKGTEQRPSPTQFTQLPRRPHRCRPRSPRDTPITPLEAPPTYPQESWSSVSQTRAGPSLSKSVPEADTLPLPLKSAPHKEW
jgi:hypothetical protein